MTFAFSFFAKAQIVETYVASDDALTTVIEKNPDASHTDVLDNLDMNDFGLGLTEVVYIKNYEHKSEVTEKLSESKKSVKPVAVQSKSNDLQTKVIKINTQSTITPSSHSLNDTDNFITSTVAPIYTVDNNLPDIRPSTDFSVAQKTEKIQQNNSNSASKQIKQKVERNPIGEKIKRRHKRAPKWKNDRRGKRDIFKCFKF